MPESVAPVSPDIKNPPILKIQVNASALIFSIFVTFIFVKLLSLLPSAYYFGFAKVVDSSATSAFVVEAPGLSVPKYCEILRSKGYFDKASGEAEVQGCMEVLGVDAPSSIGNGESTTDDGSQDALNTENQSAESEPATAPELPTLTQSERQEASALIREAGKYNFWLALVLKMLPAFVMGLICYLAWGEEALVAAPLGAAIVAFMLCWPIVSLWERVVSYEFVEQKNLFFALYTSYTIMYYAFAKMGTLIGRLATKFNLIGTEGFKIEFGKLFASIVTGAISSTITVIMTQTLAAVK